MHQGIDPAFSAIGWQLAARFAYDQEQARMCELNMSATPADEARYRVADDIEADAVKLLSRVAPTTRLGAQAQLERLLQIAAIYDDAEDVAELLGRFAVTLIDAATFGGA